MTVWVFMMVVTVRETDQPVILFLSVCMQVVCVCVCIPVQCVCVCVYLDQFVVCVRVSVDSKRDCVCGGDLMEGEGK